MKYYNGLDSWEGTHTIRVTFQQGELKGSIEFTMAGNVFGLEAMDFDTNTWCCDGKLKTKGLSIEYDEDMEYYHIQFDGEQEVLEVNADELSQMVVAVHIVKFKENEE